jgi:hypothetical protein
MSLLLLFHETGEEGPPSSEDVQQHLLLALMWPPAEGGEPEPEPPPITAEMVGGYGAGWGSPVRSERTPHKLPWKRRKQLEDDDELLIAFVTKFVETEDA